MTQLEAKWSYNNISIPSKSQVIGLNIVFREDYLDYDDMASIINILNIHNVL